MELELSLNQTEEATFTQTLPECWSWQGNTLNQLATTTPQGMSVSYVVEQDDTLIVTVKSPQPGLSSISFTGIAATPSSSCANGDTYAPEVLVNDDGQESTVKAGDELTVVSEYRLEVSKQTRGVLQHDEVDFGSGEVAASAYTYRVILYPPGSTTNIGMAFPKVADGVTITDAITLPDGVTTTQTELVGYGRMGAPQISGADTTNPVFTLSDIPVLNGSSVPNAYFDFRVWVPDTQLPNANTTVAKITDVVTADLETEGGDPIVEPSLTNNKVTAGYQNRGYGSGMNWSRSKRNYTWAGNGAATYGVNPVASNNGWNDQVFVAPDSLIQSWLEFRPKYTDGRAEEIETLDLYDVWDPTKQQILDEDIYLGRRPGGADLEASDYDNLTVYYASGADSADPASAQWETSIDAAGGATAVNAIRFSFEGLQMPDMPTGANEADRYLNIGVPFKVVASEGEDSINYYTVKGDYNAGVVSDIVKVRTTALQVATKASPEGIPSGGVTTYTVNPKLTAVNGDTVVPGLKVVDTLGAGYESLNFDDLDPAWSANASGDSSGWTVTFTYQGEASTQTDPPNIVYTAKAMFKAPDTGRIQSRSVISSAGNVSPESERYSDEVVVVTQSEVSSVVTEVESDNPMQVDAGEMSWYVNWFNYSSRTETGTSFYDILPANGDDLGSEFDGTVKLSALELVDSAANSDAVIKVTTGQATAGNLGDLTWNDYTEGMDLSDVTAVRVDVPTMAQGYDGGIKITAAVEGQQPGDVYLNNAIRYIGTRVAGSTNTTEITVVASSATGKVWEDSNGDGLDNNREPGLEGATVNIAGKSDSGADIDKTVTTNADGQYQLGALPSGDYTMTFSAPLNRAQFTVQDAENNTRDDIDSDVDSDGKVKVRVDENTNLVNISAGARGFAEISVIATLSGDSADDNESAEFGYEVVCTSNGTEVALDNGSGTLTAGTQVIVGLVPFGTNCVFTLTDPDGADGTTINGTDGDSITLSDIRADSLVTFDNRFDSGNLVISKSLGGDVTAALAGVDYDFEVSCEYRGEQLFSEPVKASIADGETFEQTGLPGGATCTVSETNSRGAEAVSINGESGTEAAVEIVASETVTAQVENRFSVGSLTVTKTVKGDAPEGQSYQFAAACTYEDAELELGEQSTFSLGADESTTLEGLPVGAKCVIEETDAADADTVRFGAEEAESAEVVVEAESSLEVTNEFDEAALPFLPNTGGNVLVPLAVALLLLGGGTAVVLVARRKRA